MTDVVAVNPNTATQVDYAVQELWAKELIMEAEKQMFWKNYEGAQGSGMPIIRKDDLSKQSGDQIHIQTLSNLTGAGVTGVNTLSGNEELLVMGQITVTPAWIRHAVGYNKDAKVKANFELRSTAKNALAYWLADKLDQKHFTAAITGATHVMYAGDATSTGTLGAGDSLSCLTLDRVKTVLRKQRALPIKTENGQVYFVIVISPDDAYQLRQDATWKTAQAEANLRGETNPIFTGALGVYNGIIVREADNSYVTGGKSKCVAFGGEFLANGYAAMPNWNEEEQDYGFVFGVGTDVCVGVSRAVEANTVVVECYAPAIS